MKRIVGLLIVLTLSTPLIGKSLKQRITDLENKVALLARNEEESWKELKRMDKEMSRLEDREIKSSNDDAATMAGASLEGSCSSK